jgi:hypothetical protein
VGNATPKGARYRRRAAECLQLAAQAVDATDKAELIEMARVWHKLAADDLRDPPDLLEPQPCEPSSPKDKGNKSKSHFK